MIVIYSTVNHREVADASGMCSGRLESICAESIDRARSVIEGMIHLTFMELQTGGNVRFEYGKPSDPW